MRKKQTYLIIAFCAAALRASCFWYVLPLILTQTLLSRPAAAEEIIGRPVSNLNQDVKYVNDFSKPIPVVVLSFDASGFLKTTSGASAYQTIITLPDGTNTHGALQFGDDPATEASEDYPASESLELGKRIQIFKLDSTGKKISGTEMTPKRVRRENSPTAAVFLDTLDKPDIAGYPIGFSLLLDEVKLIDENDLTKWKKTGRQIRVEAVPPQEGALIVPKKQNIDSLVVRTVQVATNQELLNGSQRTTLQLPIQYKTPYLFGNRSNGWLDFESNNKLSTEQLDKQAFFGATLRYQRPLAASILFPYNRLSALTSVNSNQAGTTKSITGELRIVSLTNVFMPLLGNVLRTPRAARLEISPVAYKEWLQKDFRDTSLPIRDSLLYSRASLSLSPIYPFYKGKEPSTASRWFLELTGTAYYRYDEERVGGAGSSRWESAYEAALIIPLGITRIGRLGFRDNVLGLAFSYQKSLNEASNFERTYTPSISLRLLPISPK